MTTIDPTIFKSYDIRGLYPEQISEENYPQLIKAIYTYLKQDLKKETLTIAVGRDMRVSGPVLFEKAKEELVKLGAHVIDIGLASTPTFYFAVMNYGYDCGIQISASHNPPQYTGIKFAKNVNGTIIKVGKGSGMEEIKTLALDSGFKIQDSGSSNGTLTDNDHVLKDEVEAAMKSVGTDTIKKFKIVADPANAMGSVFLEELFKHIPVELIKMNFELDGTFPVHQPDPLIYSNLTSLRERVIAEKADLGIAPDGDGDRIFFIDETGAVIQATSISAIITNAILKKTPGEKIIADIRDIRNIRELCKKLGGQFSMSIVGHAFITKQLNSERAAFAGESSGHFFFRETGGAESSLRVILYVLKTMSEEGKPLSEIAKEYITSYEHPEVNFVIAPPADPHTILATIEKDYQDGKVYHDDGLSADYENWRFNIRQSNTENEPILRVNVEGTNKELVDQNFSKLEQKILSLGGKRKDSH